MGLGGIGGVAYGSRHVAGMGFEVSLSLGLQPVDQNVALSYCSSSMLTVMMTMGYTSEISSKSPIKHFLL